MGVIDGTHRVGCVRVSHAVLGDDHIGVVGVGGPQPVERLTEPARSELPMRSAPGQAGSRHDREAESGRHRCEPREHRGSGRELGEVRRRTLGGGHAVARVPVHPQHIHRLRDRLEVAVSHGVTEDGRELGQVAAPEHGVEEQPTVEVLGAFGRRDIVGVAGRGNDSVHAEDGADAPDRTGRAQGEDGCPVREQQVVHGREPGGAFPASRRQEAGDVAGERRMGRLVHGEPLRDPVAQALPHRRGQAAEVLGEVTGHHAAAVFHPLRRIPVIQVQRRGDAPLQQSVDQPLVVVEPGLVDRARRIRHDSRPRHREAVGARPQALQQVEVFVETVILVDRAIAARSVGCGEAGVHRGVPDRRHLAVDVPGALDLVGRGAGAPGEAGGEGVRHALSLFSE